MFSELANSALGSRKSVNAAVETFYKSKTARLGKTCSVPKNQLNTTPWQGVYFLASIVHIKLRVKR